MAKDTVFTMKLDSELRDKFFAETEALDRPASQVVREMMREFVHKKEEERAHDKWFREEVEEGLRELDDPETRFFTTDEVVAHAMAAIDQVARKNEG